MILGIDPKIDYAFKRLFGREQNRALLIDLINAVLDPPPGAELVDVEILNPFNEKDLEDDKLSIVDIKARDQSGRLFNVEMQMIPDRFLQKRLLYYGARIYSQQLRDSDPYSDLRPTIVIGFIDGQIFPKEPRPHLCFELREREAPLTFSADLQLHILEIPKFKKSVEELSTTLDRWLFFLKNAEKLDADALPRPLERPAIQAAVKELTIMTQDQLERERYEARVKLHRDQISRLLSATLDGEEKGLEKGRTLGREQGREEGRMLGERKQLTRSIHHMERLLRQTPSSEEALQALSLEDLIRKQAALEVELEALIAGKQNGNGASHE